MVDNNDLKIGLRVTARFTNNFNVIEFKGEIIKINMNTCRVKTLFDGVNGWDAGHIFPIQLTHSPTYSLNNCIVEIL